MLKKIILLIDFLEERVKNNGISWGWPHKGRIVITPQQPIGWPGVGRQNGVFGNYKIHVYVSENVTLKWPCECRET
jgi:hypothetical protein